jgi:cellulose synthase/poly-beta-1,6-N-acetylglucosamine synthase-like glycosyltransferase
LKVTTIAVLEMQKYKSSNREFYYEKAARLFRDRTSEIRDDGPFSIDDEYRPLLGEDFSFENGLTSPQIRLLKSISLGALTAFLVVPILTLTVLSVLLYSIFTILIIWRLALVLVGCALSYAKAPIEESEFIDLPIYSVLVPVYNEAPIMKQLARALKKLDWPKARLDIQLLLEADDPETLKAAKKARFSRQTRFTIVPPGGPRTKPNALNYGLVQAHGKHICVYDAEDRPDPSQLKAAYRAFQNGGDDLACVQAPLIGDNSGSALIAAHWSLEYAVQLGLLMPALASNRLPLLIGGTSNHFRGLR